MIRHEFERRNVSQVTWITEKKNFSDPGTLIKSPLIDDLSLAPRDSRLLLELSSAEHRSADRPLGQFTSRKRRSNMNVVVTTTSRLFMYKLDLHLH